jgi:FkbM family methyltransferase
MWRPNAAVLLVACLASAAAGGYYVHLRQPPQVFDEHEEAAALRATYGPARNSYATEEWIIRDFFKGKRDGVFVDVGANHYQITSNTYYLEKSLNWSGVAVEPLQQYEADYKIHRPRTRFMAFFVGDASNEHARLNVPSSSTQTSSADRRFASEQGGPTREVEVPTITMDDLLDQAQITTIDFLSMDIELWEPKALAGFSISRFQPQLVCIEAHREVRQQILDYFARHRYVLVGKYLRADINNLYFTPQK